MLAEATKGGEEATALDRLKHLRVTMRLSTLERGKGATESHVVALKREVVCRIEEERL